MKKKTDLSGISLIHSSRGLLGTLGSVIGKRVWKAPGGCFLLPKISIIGMVVTSVLGGRFNQPISEKYQLKLDHFARSW